MLEGRNECPQRREILVGCQAGTIGGLGRQVVFPTALSFRSEALQAGLLRHRPGPSPESGERLPNIGSPVLMPG